MAISDYVPYAQIASSTGAAIGLLLTAWQFWRSRKTTTLQNLQDFFKSTIEREAALAIAANDQERRHAFVAFLNFLELYSAAVMGGLVTGVAKEIVSDKIVDSIITLEGASEWHEAIENSVTSEITYKYVLRFCQAYGRVLEKRRYARSKPTLG